MCFLFQIYNTGTYYRVEHTAKTFNNTNLCAHTYKVQFLVSRLHAQSHVLMSVHHSLLVSSVFSHRSSAEILIMSLASQSSKHAM